MDTISNIYKHVAENVSDLVALHTPDGRYLWVSPSVERILGYSPQDLIGSDPYELFHPDDREAIRNTTHEPAVTGDGNILIRYRIRRADGEYIWFETLTQPIEDDQGKVVKLHTTSRDVTDQHRLESALAESEALYRAAMESLEEGIVIHDAEGRIVAHNPRSEEILGLSSDELQGRVSRDPRWEAVHGDGRPFLAEDHPVTVTLRTGAHCSHVLMGVYNPRWASRRWISINSRPIANSNRGESGRAVVVVSFADVTESIEREAQLQRWSTVYRFSGEAIVIADADGIVRDVNEAFLKLVQNDKEAWLGSAIDELALNGRTECVFASTIWPAMEARGHWRGELWLRDSGGGVQVTWAAMTKVQQSVSAEANYTLILSDFSERTLKEEKLRYYAGHDSLTGLPNRLLLTDRFEVAISTAVRDRTTFACLYLDLDRFKPINDRYGHSVGDELLQAVAGKISASVRSVDTVSRIGGDEFVVLIVGLDGEAEYRAVAERIARSLSQPVEIDEHQLNLGVSIGVALYPRHGNSQNALIQASDAAMYRAKGEGVLVELAESSN